MKDIRAALREKRLYFDGGFGTCLQEMGLPTGTPPEAWNLTEQDKIVSLHRSYIESGSNIITTNTFGVNPLKYGNYDELIRAAVDSAKKAAVGREVYIAFDIGPTGKMLEPLGDLPFDAAVEAFAENVRSATRLGVDLIVIETMNDSYETKAALLAAKENSTLPVFVTNAYDKSGKLMTGASPEAVIAMLEGMGADAIGMNCSFGPDCMTELAEKYLAASSLPLIVNPNAGLPRVRDGRCEYDITPDEFAEYMARLAEMGASVLGGCCGTTPEYIAATVRRTSAIPLRLPDKKSKTVVSSFTHAVEIGDSPVLIGERINPTGKPKLKAAISEGNFDYIRSEAIRESDSGAAILDVNVGIPGINESEAIKRAVSAIQEVSDTPLQIDSADTAALEAAMRIYNGKPMINSVNGDEAKMDAVFPLVAKYGGVVVALTMDGSGIPETAEGRCEIAERIARRAADYGIRKHDIVVDPLCLTVSSDPLSAIVTLRSVELLRSRGFKTVLGVSNISFGLPSREKINAAFFASALERGLNCAIMNPFSAAMTDTYYAFRALHGFDESCSDYIDYASGKEEAFGATADNSTVTLEYAIKKGLKKEAAEITRARLASDSPLDIINKSIIPALNEVGECFERKVMFLPQLIMSAESASAAFDVIKERMTAGEADNAGEIILATVKGDIHDIGKNIVKVLLESYGYKVYDLGKDVCGEEIVRAAEKTGCRLIGLSALMTTTVPSMARTIKLLRERFSDVKIVCGGAVLTEEYAREINADKYSPDAMETVRYAAEFYSGR